MWCMEMRQQVLVASQLVTVHRSAAGFQHNGWSHQATGVVRRAGLATVRQVRHRQLGRQVKSVVGQADLVTGRQIKCRLQPEARSVGRIGTR